jgi:hypothetical protein
VICLIRHENFKQSAHFYELHGLGDLGSPIIELTEFVFENNLDARLSINVQFFPWFVKWITEYILALTSGMPPLH